MRLINRAWTAVLGPSGWRSVIAPLSFAAVGIALLVYDHLNRRVPALVFWMTLGLIVTVFVRMLETNRRQSRALAKQRSDALNDDVTGLRNRGSLEADVAAAAMSGDDWVLVLLELEGLEMHSDQLGYSAGDTLLRDLSRRLVDAVVPLGGIAYRVAASRLAILVPAADRELGEIVITAIGSLQSDDIGATVGRSYGEVRIPEEAGDAEVAFQVANKRLAAHRQRQHRSARRQAHAVLMAAITARDPELRDDLRSAADRSVQLARRLQLERGQVDDIALAAELHNAGLLAVPESILKKELPLDEGELALVHSHTAEGERIVGAAAGLEPVATLIRSSAEHFDGGGYPDGLVGNAIPLGSRLIAVAVAFTAMTGRRAYSESMSPGEALAELRRNSGSQFDPRVVEALAVDLAEEAAPAAAHVQG